MLGSILQQTGEGIVISDLLICTLVSLVLGALIALVFTFKNTYSKNFVFSLALMPVLVQSVIMLVNGNLGAGVAVMGAFSLVRFRSVPGNAREISSIFFAMGIGLATGMGYIAYALIFTAIISIMMFAYSMLGFGVNDEGLKRLRIMMPEDADYNDLFNDLFNLYASDVKLDKVRTVNMGSLFELQYTVNIKDSRKEKEFIDELRKRNGNLAISLGYVPSVKDEL